MNGAPLHGDSALSESPAELSDIARLGYIYGLPCYEFARLRYRALSLPRKGGPLRLNVFHHTRALSTPESAIVTAVNSDTLLSRAWLDLSGGPLLITAPDGFGRYYSLALMDVFTNNFAVLAQRAAGTAATRFLLAGPRWDGIAPSGVTTIRAPTNAVWALLRILVNGAADLPAVHALQDQFALARWGEAPSLASGYDPLSRPVPPLDNDKPLVFFDVLNAMLTENPPPARDQPVLERLRIIGVGPSLRFRRQDFSPAQLDALRKGVEAGRETIRAQVGFRTETPRRTPTTPWPSDALLARLRVRHGEPRQSAPRNRRIGWSGPVGDVGDFGSDYLLRAQCALAGLGLLPREEAMYFSTATDASGARLEGRHRYVLHFPSGGLPPVEAFWSVTIYQTDENNRRWLAPNPIGRYSVGSQQTDLRYGADGSLTIFIQRDAPSAPDENWLPAPDAPFMLTLRAYQPRRALLEGSYEIPEVRLRSAPA